MTVQIKRRGDKTTFVIQFTLNKKRRSICLGNRYTLATAQMVDAVVERSSTVGAALLFEFAVAPRLRDVGESLFVHNYSGKGRQRDAKSNEP